jgi:hypothetical protein
MWPYAAAEKATGLFYKKSKTYKANETTTTKANKPQPEKKPLYEPWKNIRISKRAYVYRKQKRKMNAAYTYYKNNTLSKEADSKTTERAETMTRKRLLI